LFLGGNMSFWILLILAVVQGLTEFLPVSSSGHLVLLYNWFGVEDGGVLLSILLHIATLMAVLVYYRKEVIQLIKNPLCPTNRKLIITTVCTCVVVLIIKPFIDFVFEGEYLFVFFIITAILLFVSDYVAEKKSFLSRTSVFVQKNIEKNNDGSVVNLEINYKQAILMGLTQGLACIPGISRSGSTIAIGRIVGVKDSTRYSFLMSIPIIVASFVMELFYGGAILQNVNVVALIVAMVVCFVVGLLCIKLMTKLVSSNRLTWFSYYLIGLSTILVVAMFL
jgi:undecaprenyl-diphosphatase